MSLSTRLSCAFSLALLALAPTAGWGQAKPPDKGDSVTFTTGDFAELRGYWYPGSKGKQSPTVLLLHSIGSDCRKDGWKSLAENLNKKGFAVLAFDFRGHGRSEDIDAKSFWALNHNAAGIKTFRPGMATLPSSIEQGDFRPDYLPHLINDIYAAKTFIEEKNDRGECNASQLILIGAEDSATLGALFVAAECRRHKYSMRTGADPVPESRDILCCIWLSMSRNLGGKSVSGSLTSWLKDAVAHEKNKIPMAFLYGEGDSSADSLALSAVRLLKPGYVRDRKIEPGKDKFAATGDHKVANAKGLAGSKLLHKDLGTESWIVDTYLGKAVFQKKAKGDGIELNDEVQRFKDLSFDWTEHDFRRTFYVWQVGRSVVPILKEDKDKALPAVPLGSLGLLR